ncbi:MAG: 30S ribosomal protein S6 [Treponema sp.]|nr:30S ribosomal protein S6 [Treponema sp.]
MRKYELMTIFPLDEDRSKKGLETVRQVLSQFGAEIAKEEPFGDRDLTYEIKKQKKGRFILMNVNANPGKIAEISAQFKLNNDLLKYMFVLIEE